MPVASEDLLISIVSHSGRLSPQMRKALTTFLLLANPIDYVRVLAQFRTEIVKGALQSDPRLLLSIYRSLPRHLKIELVTLFAVSAVEPRAFRTMFEDAFLRCQPRKSQRAALARAFSRYFSLHSKIGAGGMEDLILRLLRSREEEQRLHGLLVVNHLEEISEADLRLIVRSVRSRTRGWSNNAWSALARLTAKPGVLKPALIAELRELAKVQARNPDRHEAHNPRLFLQVTEPGQRKRKRRRGNPLASLGVIG